MKMHLFHYVVLFVILLGGAATFFFTLGNTHLQFLVGVITVFSYAAWGCIHHALLGELNAKIMIEYILIGGIAIVLMMTILQ